MQLEARAQTKLTLKPSYRKQTHLNPRTSNQAHKIIVDFKLFLRSIRLLGTKRTAFKLFSSPIYIYVCM